MDDVPVANHDQNQQQEGDYQQAGSFRSVNRVPAVLMAGVVVVLDVDHDRIVRFAERARGVVVKSRGP
jgi:hypothetical protein